ncbi:MAG TPA: MarR family winged helix-turn-helix transcriptional regulator [Caldimonas sp.]|nr:MarR family winged helix-turn-helix transcriptional regulator [Caldimonas sp.]
MASQPSPRVPAEPAVRASTTQAGEDASVRVLRRFRLVFNAVKSHFQHIEKASGIGGAQVWALSIIGERPGLGVTDLARAMDVHQSTASNLVRSLVERGLVDTTRAGPDRRAVQLRLLAAGRRVLRRAPPPLTGVLPQALARLDEATLRRLDHDLAELIAVLDTDHDAAHQPLAHL